MIITLLIVTLLDLVLARPYAENECPNSSVSPADHKTLFKRINSGCSTSGPASCSGLDVSDTCCTEFPAGLILLTQDWKTNPTVGPIDSWTIHGLWLDNCDGSTADNCDKERVYSDITGLLTSQGASDTLNFMQTFWGSINKQYTDETFWEHEWSIHGTCFSTLKPSCVPNGSPQGAEAVAYFQTAVSLFQTLPTYSWLSNQGIIPSETETYSLSALIAAIKAEWGFTPSLTCKRGMLVGIFYHFHLRGSAIDGIFVPIDAAGEGSCPPTGIKYPTKLGPLTSTTSTTSYATIKNSAGGGIIAAGNWMMQPLPNFSLSGSISSFTLKSQKGICGVSDGIFSCGKSVIPSTFSAVPSGDKLLLAFGGSTAFSSDEVARSVKQQRIYTGDSHPVVYTLEIAPSGP